MPNVTTGYGSFSDSIAFLEIFIYYKCLKRYSLIKLLQMCFKAEMSRWKVNLFNHLCLRQSEFFNVFFVCKHFLPLLQPSLFFMPKKYKIPKSKFKVILCILMLFLSSYWAIQPANKNCRKYICFAEIVLHFCLFMFFFNLF